MIRHLTSADHAVILAVINDGAQAYKGVIPADRWHDPYMSAAYLDKELAAGVEFWGWEADGHIVGVMGQQDLGEVTLIRHAYVLTAYQRQGIGARLLNHLLARITGPVLVGTWAAAWWAVRFYEKHGFRLTTPEEKTRLLQTYWSIPVRQVETSVVLELTTGEPRF